MVTKTMLNRFILPDRVASKTNGILNIAKTPIAVDAPPVDADTAEQLAFMLWAWFSPISVLVVAHDSLHDRAVVELAVGATGCRLRGFEGLQQPWATLATTLDTSRRHGDFLETSTHPFSHHTRRYLILAHVRLERWFIVCQDQGG